MQEWILAEFLTLTKDLEQNRGYPIYVMVLNNSTYTKRNNVNLCTYKTKYLSVHHTPLCRHAKILIPVTHNPIDQYYAEVTMLFLLSTSTVTLE